MDKSFEQITKKGNYVAWTNKTEPETTAIAYMTDDNWFDTAINCIRDGDMGEKDADGVYSRHWGGDAVWTDDNPRLATEEEIELYDRKTRKKPEKCMFVNKKSGIVPKGYPNAHKYISAGFAWSVIMVIIENIVKAKGNLDIAKTGVKVAHIFCTTDDDWDECVKKTKLKCHEQ